MTAPARGATRRPPAGLARMHVGDGAARRWLPSLTGGHTPPAPGRRPGRLTRVPWRLVALLTLTAVPAIAEAAVVRGAGLTSALGLSPQVSAPAPFGVFHDLRWVLVFHSSWGGFAGEMAAMIAFRTLLNTAIVALAWPREADRPRLRRLGAENAAATVVAAAVLSPWAAVAVAGSVTALSWFILAELLPVVVLALVLQRGGLTLDWWRGLPSLQAIGWALVTFGALSADALVVALAPGWWAVPAAGAAGASNAFLWRRLARAALLSRRSRAPALTAPVAVVATAGVLLAMGRFFIVGPASAAGPPPALRSRAGNGARAVAIYVGGYDSSFSGAHGVITSPGLILERYSYRGLGRGGRPLPYPPAATHQSLRRSARLLARQIAALRQRTGRRVGLVAESEGTLVARAYLDHAKRPPVDALVLLSPLAQPGRAYFPPPGATGWGLAAGWLLRGMLTSVRLVGGPSVRTGEPFVRSVLNGAPQYRNRMLCPVPGVRSVAFLSLASAVALPPGLAPDMPVVELPGVHASLATRRGVREEAVRVLRGAFPRSRTTFGFTVVRDAAAAWQAPALPLALNPVWRYPPGRPDAALGQSACPPSPARSARASRPPG